MSNINYLDIGAHHYKFLSNTYLFYKQGYRGVLVEPNPELCADLKKKRPGDKIVNAGIGSLNKEDELFYITHPPELSSFSKEWIEGANHSIKQTISIPIFNINSLIEKYFAQSPTLISLDIEGLDLEVINSFDFKKFRPAVLCIETVSKKDGQKDSQISKIMSNNGYIIYADTHINTIYVEKELYNKRLTS